MKKIKLITTFIILFLSQDSFALEAHPFIGAYSYYFNSNDPNYKYEDRLSPEGNINSLIAGLAFNQNNLIFGATTNRIINKSVISNIKNKQTGRQYQNSTLTTIDTFFTGYQIQRWQPRIFISNTNLKKELYQNNILLGKANQSAILYGISLGYFLTKNIQAAIVYVAPNRELYLESGFGLGLNYIF